MAEKKNKVDYAAIIREYLTYHNGESLKHFCDEGGYHYASVQRYFRRAFWDSKSKVAEKIEGCQVPSFIPVEMEDKTPELPTPAAKPQASAVKIERISVTLADGMQISFENGHPLQVFEVLRKIAE